MNGELEEARRELTKKRIEFNKARAKFYYFRVLEELSRIRDVAIEKAKGEGTGMLEQLVSDLVELR